LAGWLTSIFKEGFGLDTGSDGSYPYSYGEGLNFTMNLGIDTIDFATFHLYPSSCTHTHLSPKLLHH
jgi:mannan endo-1,4-beta-mannosidase